MYSIFSEFSDQQIEEAGGKLPAVKRYANLLRNLGETNFKTKRLNEWLRLALHSYFNSEDQKISLKRWSLFVESEVHQFFENKNPSDLGIYALGKLGAHELNLSSDIDLIFVGEFSPENKKLCHSFIKKFGEIDKFSFFTRVDIEIRPGGSHSPIIQNTNQVENYYFYHGETWERLALIRLNAIFSNKNIDQQIQSLRTKFCFRRHIDFNTFDEFSRLRTRIHNEISRKTSEGKIDIKLFPGCIRDIELFTHSLCAIYGGRNKELDLRSTEAALLKLAELKIISTQDSSFLITHYWKLRRLENLIQAKEDLQTHSTDTHNWLIDKVFGSQDSFDKEIEHCHQVVSGFLQLNQTVSEKLPNSIEEQLSLLTKLGFDKKLSLNSWNKIIKHTAKSRYSEKDEEIRKEVIFAFLTKIKEHSEDKNLALQILGDFFKATRAKASLFRFFQVHPEVIVNLSHLFGLSPSRS